MTFMNWDLKICPSQFAVIVLLYTHLFWCDVNRLALQLNIGQCR